MSYHFITTLQLKGYSGSDGTLVGDKYIRLALLASFLLLCPFLLARLYFQDVGEVDYSLTENKMYFSTCLGPLYGQPLISSSRLTYLSNNNNNKTSKNKNH